MAFSERGSVTSKDDQRCEGHYVIGDKYNVTLDTHKNQCERNGKKGRPLSHYRTVECIRSTGLGWAAAAVVRLSKPSPVEICLTNTTSQRTC
jgi:hypothetical protein